MGTILWDADIYVKDGELVTVAGATFPLKDWWTLNDAKSEAMSVLDPAGEVEIIGVLAYPDTIIGFSKVSKLELKHLVYDDLAVRAAIALKTLNLKRINEVVSSYQTSCQSNKIRCLPRGFVWLVKHPLTGMEARLYRIVSFLLKLTTSKVARVGTGQLVFEMLQQCGRWVIA